METDPRLIKLEHDVTEMKTLLEVMYASIKKLHSQPSEQQLKPQMNKKPQTNKPQPIKPQPIVLVTCELCKNQIDRTKVFDVKSQGKNTYECVDTKECNKGVQLLREKERKIKEEQRRSRLSELERNMEDNYDELVEKFGTWEKEEQIKMIFGVDFDDLIELPRARDASIHYRHKDTERKYTWSMYKKVWSLGNEEYLKGFDDIYVCYNQ